MTRIRTLAPDTASGRVIGVVLLTTLLASCKIERTPDAFVDHHTPVQEERTAAAAELRDRLLALTQALNRGDSGEAMAALEPAPDAYLVGPEAGAATGAEQIQIALQQVADSAMQAEVVMRDLEVDIGPRQSVAWFRGSLHASGSTPEAPVLRMTGVYLRDAGVWRLVQAHVSRPVTEPAPPPPSSPTETAADSAGGE